MNNRALACMLAVSLVAACSHNDSTGSANGTGGTNGTGYGDNGAGSGYGAGAGAGRATPGSQEDLQQSAGDRIFFETDSSTISPQAASTLDRQAQWLQQYAQVNVWVAGNCDERGTEEYNLALGQRRANADRDYLVAHGIPRSRIETISYGKSRPIDPASSPEAWTQNRNAITSIR